jgi:dihydrolipoamide dehydrogenase
LPETTYDVAIIGSGPAGYTAAIRAGQYGLKTALIEKDSYLGGTCLHVGCIPTKALLFNAELWDHLKDASEFGIEGVNSRKLNWEAVLDRKGKIVSKHAKGLEFLMRKNKVETLKGYGKLTGPAHNGVHTIELKDGSKSTQVRAKNVILATGSEARMIPGLQPDDRVLTNIEILKLGKVPKSLIVVGAGAVGVEFASIFRSFDCEVTILEMLPRMKMKKSPRNSRVCTASAGSPLIPERRSRRLRRTRPVLPSLSAWRESNRRSKPRKF